MALHAAAADGSITGALAALFSGVSVDATEEGATALPVACREDWEEVVILLLDQGAEANNADNNGWTPLHHSCYKGHSHIAAVLLSRGADIARRTSTGATALMLSCDFGYMDTISVLLGRGAAIDDQDIDGNTAMHIASRYFIHTTRLIIRNKADIHIRNSSGKTPMDVCRRPEWREELTELYNTVNRAWLARKSFLFVLIGCGFIEELACAASQVPPTVAGAAIVDSEHDRLRDDTFRLLYRVLMPFL